MEIKKVMYYNTVPQFLKPKLFCKRFSKCYSVQIEDIEAGSNFEVDVEYEGNLEVYFVKFMFRKKGGGMFSGNSENELDIYCNNELSATVILE